MHIVFPTAFHYPSKTAHARHGMEMARAFTRILGEKFLFVVAGTTDKKLFQNIRYVEAHTPRSLERLHLRTLFLFFWLARFFLKHPHNNDAIVFVNDRKIAVAVIALRYLFRYRVIFEFHAVFHTYLDTFLAQQADGLVFTTKGLIELLSSSLRPLRRAYRILPNAVNLEYFERQTASKSELRKTLNLPQRRVLIGYSGWLTQSGMDKGIRSMIEALAYLDENFALCFVGGTREEIKKYTRIAKEHGMGDRCTFVDIVPHEHVSRYLCAMDIVAYIPPATDKFFTHETSPMKIFEYMASRRPMIVSDLPSLREVLSEKVAVFVKPADPAEFAHAVLKITQDPSMGALLASAAYQMVREFTWEKRAEKVLELARKIMYG